MYFLAVWSLALIVYGGFMFIYPQKHIHFVNRLRRTTKYEHRGMMYKNERKHQFLIRLIAFLTLSIGLLSLYGSIHALTH